LLDHAHKLDHLLALDSILVRRSLEAHRKLRDDAWSLLFLNVDGRLMHEWENVRDMLLGHLRDFELEPVDICIELSEQNQDLQADDFARAVDGLRAAGFSIAIDDFGTGDSGLQMLYQSNPDFIKIDRFFISSMPHDSKKRLLVHSIVELAHTLGAKVIAEGIETDAELAACREVNCDLAQGYLVAKPTGDHALLRHTYPVVLSARERTTDRQGEPDLADLMEDIAVLSENDPLSYLVDLLMEHRDQPVFPVIDRNGIPRGTVFESDIKTLMYSQYGRALAQNLSLEMSVLDYLKPIPMVDLDTPIGPRLEFIAEHAGHGVLVTKAMRYVGYLSSTSLVKLSNTLRLQEASNSNPLSGLPGNQAIMDYLAMLQENPGQPRLACYVDIDNFKPFNDRYGFEAGDRAILMLASILESLQRDHGVFAGHVGGDDFFIGAIGAPTNVIDRFLPNLAERFSHVAESLYSPEDRAAGQIQGKSRSGEDKTFPLLTCTVVGTRLEVGETVDDTQSITGHLAELKSDARAMSKSFLVQSLQDKSPASGPSRPPMRPTAFP
ncbi:MAG: EAL domain-containing protein, partial [Pseudomonadota bacterium]